MPVLGSENIHRRTDSILRNISEQYNPNLRIFLNAGRAYEKALAAVSTTSKVYFDAMSRLGVIAGESASAKDLGESMREVAETLRLIQLHYEDTVKFLNAEVFYPLENKLEHDTKYMLGVQKKYLGDYRIRIEDLERVQMSHKKMKRKSYTGKKSYKYDEKEKQLAETVTLKQKSLDQFQHENMKQAFIEERRRYCFFVEQQCELAKRSINYHRKAMESLGSQLAKWTDSCADVKNLPRNASNLLDLSKPDETSSLYSIPEPPSEPAVQLNGIEHGSTMPNRSSTPTNRPALMQEEGSQTLPKSNTMNANNASGHNIIPRESRKRVTAVFAHSVPGSSAQLDFEQGDVIVLMIPQPRDGWHYGENDRTKLRGWFPYSYTKMVDSVNAPERQQEPVVGHMPLPPPDYNSAQLNGVGRNGPSPTQDLSVDPYKAMKDQFLSGNPFANIKLRKTLENGDDSDGTNQFSTFK